MCFSGAETAGQFFSRLERPDEERVGPATWECSSGVSQTVPLKPQTIRGLKYKKKPKAGGFQLVQAGTSLLMKIAVIFLMRNRATIPMNGFYHE